MPEQRVDVVGGVLGAQVPLVEGLAEGAEPHRRRRGVGPVLDLDQPGGERGRLARPQVRRLRQRQARHRDLGPVVPQRFLRRVPQHRQRPRLGRPAAQQVVRDHTVRLALLVQPPGDLEVERPGVRLGQLGPDGLRGPLVAEPVVLDQAAVLERVERRGHLGLVEPQDLRQVLLVAVAVEDRDRPGRPHQVRRAAVQAAQHRVLVRDPDGRLRRARRLVVVGERVREQRVAAGEPVARPGQPAGRLRAQPLRQHLRDPADRQRGHGQVPRVRLPDDLRVQPRPGRPGTRALGQDHQDAGDADAVLDVEQRAQ